MKVRATGAPGPELTASGSGQRFWWALLITLFVVLFLWGFFQPLPFNLILWGLGLTFLAIFLLLVYRRTRAQTKLEFAEVRRLIVCDKCGVETEGPLEAGDHIFREIGPCPRCEGRLYIKAIYSIDSKEPLKRQKPKEVKTEANETDLKG